MNNSETLTCHAVRRLLNGHPPNGVQPEDCGPYAEHIEALNKAHADGGTEAVQRVFVALSKTDPALARLLAGDASHEDNPSSGERSSPSGAESNGKRRAGPEGSDPAPLKELDAAPRLPDEAFELLPPLFSEPCAMFGGGHRRDVFLTGALCITSGCLPNVEGYYGADVPQMLRPNLYGAVVAGAAGGKSALGWSRRMAAPIDEAIKARSEKARKLWADRREHADGTGEPFDEPEPPPQSLFLPADSSASHFFRSLRDCGERAVLYSSEIDTLTNAIGQEWGKFDDLLRQAYHHEGKGYGRKSEGKALWLESPSVSAVLSGTPAQYAALMQGSTENGLYSRFLLYYFDAAEDFHSQRPTTEGICRAERFEALGADLKELYEALSRREKPLRFRLEDRHWAERVGTFRPLLRRARMEGAGHLEAVVKRAGVWAFRISMTLRAVRAFEQGVPLSKADTLVASDEDVRASLLLAETYADHALRFGLSRLQAVEPSARQKRITKLLGHLSGEFGSGEAYRLAKVLGLDVSKRTIRDDLRHAEKQGLIKRLNDNGRWEVTQPPLQT